MKILGIETSCDETAASVVQGGVWVHSNVIASQIALHQAHGGVVPELAARGHITAIVPVIEAALAEAGIDRSGIDAVAVTNGPGLAGSLLVGVNVAKAFAYAIDRPLVPVNHLEAHVGRELAPRTRRESRSSHIACHLPAGVGRPYGIDPDRQTGTISVARSDAR